jgi:hypothetical protein
LWYFTNDKDWIHKGFIDLNQVTQVLEVGKDKIDLVTEHRTYRIQLISQQEGTKYYVEIL